MNCPDCKNQFIFISQNKYKCINCNISYGLFLSVNSKEKYIVYSKYFNFKFVNSIVIKWYPEAKKTRILTFHPLATITLNKLLPYSISENTIDKLSLLK